MTYDLIFTVKPTILYGPQPSMSVEENTTIEIRWTIRSNPNAVINVNYNNQEKAISIQNNEANITHTFDRIQCNQSGLYSISASNILGNVNDSLNLVVICE